MSLTFDNFTSIPLSLPEPSKILINIIIYRLPSDIKDLLNGTTLLGKVFSHSALNKPDSFRSDEAEDAVTTIPIMHSIPTPDDMMF